MLFKTKSDSGTALSDEEKANKKAQAEAVLQRVKNGEDITTIAKDLSEDTGTKDKGGSYTVYMDGQTDESYANAVKSMQVGDVVLVESSYGYHVIKLASITENGRAKNEYDRENFVNENINKISTEKNFKVNSDNLKKLLNKLQVNLQVILLTLHQQIVHKLLQLITQQLIIIQQLILHLQENKV